MATPRASAQSFEQTLDLWELARVLKNEHVEVQKVQDRTDELFQKTLKLLRSGRGALHEETAPAPGPWPWPQGGSRYIPENEDLRKIYLFAEALGGYERLHDLINQYSPGRTLFRRYGDKVGKVVLREHEFRALEEYQRQINEALKNAHQYLLSNPMDHFSAQELHELFELLSTAMKRSRDLNRLIGAHLMHRVEQAVHRLHEYRDKMRSVERTVDGIFLVDSEVMFISTGELIDCVDAIFQSIGNPYFAEHVDGVLLLAARNLLIEVVSFQSYYGKQQIYNLCQRGGSAANRRAISQRIRDEVRKLFEACEADNKLVLTRVMKHARREFEISVEAIEMEAVQTAFEEVRRFIPEEPAEVPRRKRGLIARLLGWLRA